MLGKRYAAAAAAVTAVAAVAAVTASGWGPAAGSALRPAAAPPADHPAGEGQPAGERISVGRTTCAPGWRAPNPGRDHFAVANTSDLRGVIYLFHPVSGRIVARIRHSRPHSVRGLTVALTPGAYMWGCDLAGTPPRNSEAEVVPQDPNRGGGGPPVVPVNGQELAGPRTAYRGYLRRSLGRLRARVAALGAAIGAGDLTAARNAWLAAHVSWLEIGQDDGAYGIFGPLGRAVDGTSAGLVRGTADARFTGFHKIEADLWRDRDLAAAGADTAALARNVATLSRQSGTVAIPLSDVPLRCHEILEDALRDTLSGADEYGSGTGLASVLADVTATREVLGLVAPLLAPRSPGLVAAARDQLSRLAAAVTATRSGRRWTAVARLSLVQRERINGAAGAALETLAPVPDLLRLGNS